MSFFPEDDDGTPPIICGSKHCPLHHDNWLNDLYIFKLAGKIGFSYCDKHRKLLGAIATFVTLFAILLTVWGCVGFSVNSSIIQRTYWAGGIVTNSSAISNKDYTIYIGLRAAAYVPCTFEPGYDYYGSSCHVNSVEYGDPQCDKGVVAGACHDCSSAAVALYFTAISSCLGLVIALFGTQARMRVAADTPVQKIVGIVTETLGVIALVFTLTVFDANCLYPLRRSYAWEGLSATFWSGKLMITYVSLNMLTNIYPIFAGPGIWCYAFCATSGGVRAIVHWITPVPTQSLLATLPSGAISDSREDKSFRHGSAVLKSAVPTRSPLSPSARGETGQVSRGSRIRGDNSIISLAGDHPHHTNIEESENTEPEKEVAMREEELL